MTCPRGFGVASVLCGCAVLISCGGRVRDSGSECAPGDEVPCSCVTEPGTRRCSADGTWTSDCDCGTGGSSSSELVTGTGGSAATATGGTITGTGAGGTPEAVGGAGLTLPQGLGGSTVSPDESPGLGVIEPQDFLEGGGDWLDAGPWKGFAWTGSEEPPLGTVIEPDVFQNREPGSDLCVTGTVAPDPDWGGVAELGVCVNQEMGGGGENGTCGGVWDPTGYQGIAYELTNALDTSLQLRLVGALGYPEEAWCAIIDAPSGQIAWNAFNEMCWDNRGAWYDQIFAPIDSVRIAVTGHQTQPVEFSFCLHYLSPY